MLRRQRPWQQRYLERFYYGRGGWVSGTAHFHELIRGYLPREKHVLELGPGPKNSTSEFLCANYSVLDGLDVDEEARQNPFLREAHIYQGGAWPIAAASYDAVVADYVVEHLADPPGVASEACRVLRPGGVFFFRTPNLWHYVSIVSWLSPHWFHRLVANRLRNRHAGAHDPYPTYYRMNRRRTVRAVLGGAGFEEVELLTIEKEPSYGMSSRALFLLFMAYERLVNCWGPFAALRANMLGVYRKPGAE